VNSTFDAYKLVPGGIYAVKFDILLIDGEPWIPDVGQWEDIESTLVEEGHRLGVEFVLLPLCTSLDPVPTLVQE